MESFQTQKNADAALDDCRYMSRGGSFNMHIIRENGESAQPLVLVLSIRSKPGGVLILLRHMESDAEYEGEVLDTKLDKPIYFKRTTL